MNRHIFRGKIRYYTHPPETQNMATHIDASLVTQMSQEFDIDALLQEEQDQMLKGNYLSPFKPKFIVVIFIHYKP